MTTEATTSSATNSSNEFVSPIASFTIEKNGVSFAAQIAAEAKGPTKGHVYVAPVTPLTMDQIVQIMGAEYALKQLTKVVKGSLKEVGDDSHVSNDEGVFNADFKPADFQAVLTEYNFVSETIKELKDKKESVLQQWLASDDTTTEGVAKANELKAQLKAINQKIKDKQRPSQSEGEEEAPVAQAA